MNAHRRPLEEYLTALRKVGIEPFVTFEGAVPLAVCLTLPSLPA